MMKLEAFALEKHFGKMFWEYDEYNIWNLKFKNDEFSVHAFIQQRPHYCDRGHVQLNIDMHHSNGLPVMDRQDGFPRYYMSFETAKTECELFLLWRILKIPNER